MNLADLPERYQRQIKNEDRRKPSSAVAQCGVRPDSLGQGEAKGGDPKRFLVRVASFRRRLLDEDNLVAKFVIDCCRYAGILHSDAPGQTKIEVAQFQVKTKAEQRTEIQITPPVLLT